MNIYLDIEADEGDEEEEEDDEDSGDDDKQDQGGSSVRSPKVTVIPGPSAKDTLSKKIDEIYNNATKVSSSSRRHISLRASRSPTTLESRMYLLHVHRTAAVYIAEYLQGKGFSVTVSPWLPGQLYVVSDSPRTIASSLPSSHKLSVKDYHRISDEERIAVENSEIKFPNPSWVRVKSGMYKGAIGYVFDPDQSDLFVDVLVAVREFPYTMPSRSEALLDRSRLPKDKTVTDIIRNGEIIGCSYKGHQYYRGLLLKKFHRYQLELVACPHADDVRLHLQSGFDTPFVKKSIVAFSMQFLRVGDAARIIAGAARSEIGTVVSIDHAFGGSARIELTFDGHRTELEARHEDMERVFWVGDAVRVVAGSHLGLEGHIIQMDEVLFLICQWVSMEEVQVSKYYLDRRHQACTIQPHLPSHQHFEPPPESQSLEIGDSIEVLVGKHIGKRGVVTWSSIGGDQLWFQDESPQTLTLYNTKYYSGPPSIQVPVTFVHRTHLPQTITFTKEKGYDVKPGDIVRVARGPEYQMKGIMQSVDFPKARLTLLSESDHLLIDVPIGFVMKILNVSSDSFDKVIGQEVFVVGGDRKGFQATLYGIGGENCTVAINGQARTTLKCQNVVTKYGMRLNGLMLGESDLIEFCDLRKRSYVVPQPRRCITPPPDSVPSNSSNSISAALIPSSSNWTCWNLGQDLDSANDLSPGIDLSSSTPDPWTIDAQDIQDSIDARAERPKDSGPLPWFMGKEFSTLFLTYHAVFTVSLSFNHAKLYK
ncbi:hypothetical protein DEU56DRAFT_912143 [Suillus clintonianus]|uniref:uncharacterized protein n=1 Tax=Suillus clintonianus TaxID=1904413 RepID=UPI001B861B53|nr:uncharacterized protein DEU56DRAFT_912143 [Suillus clintonianus]KAG2139300.1 hypothetical protein DEU56DRAFT_912143 [Suillus clintonianus]